MFRKIRKKFFKYMLPFACANGVRVFLLRAAGYHVGKAVYVGENLIVSDTLINRGNVHIGDRVSIAPRVTIITDSSPNHSILNRLYPLETRPVRIEDDAWLGVGVIVLPGVEIGKGAVIGSGAVVTENIPPFSVAVGNPARVIKKIDHEQLQLDSEI